jgi:hypothetical protein
MLRWRLRKDILCYHSRALCAVRSHGCKIKWCLTDCIHKLGTFIRPIHTAQSQLIQIAIQYCYHDSLPTDESGKLRCREIFQFWSLRQRAEFLLWEFVNFQWLINRTVDEIANQSQVESQTDDFKSHLAEIGLLLLGQRTYRHRLQMQN